MRVLRGIGALGATALTAVLLMAAAGSGESVESDPVPERDEMSRAAADQDALITRFSGQTPTAAMNREFRTDFAIASISFSEVISGGPPKDGIPAIDEPVFEPASAAASWLDPREPVLVLTVDGQSRMYPVQILMWHEIVNDIVGGQPVVVTYCPLCNTGIAFDAALQTRGGESLRLDFGTTGRLRLSNLLMYDRQSETWWQQATGLGVIGRYTGVQLEILPLLTLAFADARRAFPDAVVLSRDTGFSRSYGVNPYTRYDQSQPFLYQGPAVPEDFHPTDRVVVARLGDAEVAFPYPDLRRDLVLEAEVSGEPVVAIWQPGVASALDTRAIAEGRDVGTANVFRPEIDGMVLSFLVEGGEITDRQTGSTWNAAGRALTGPLAGAQLPPLPSVQHFWFSWAAFRQTN